MNAAWEDDAVRDLKRLSADVAQRVIDRVTRLAENFENERLEALTGPLSGNFKLRVGDYRVVFLVDRLAETIHVLWIKHRSEAYR